LHRSKKRTQHLESNLRSIMSYKTTIGLEVHAELATNSKMFCGCKNDPHAGEVNAYTCPVCLAHPGTLPVPNKEAIAMVLRFGQAIGAGKADYSEFDRKNYFYPDIPKAYQISQYKYPFLTGGEIEGVELTRVHLEEDTARSSHELADASIVDFNRAGVPLMELVTEPVLHDSTTAGAFARELQLLLQTLGISDANMERGEMRIEANISISDSDELGTKVEVKNINSFKAVEAAIDYEVARQKEMIESGEDVAQETRGWDENNNRTFSQRSKETAKDYRYFPDPDITKLQVSEILDYSEDVLAEKIPKLPKEKRDMMKSYDISDDIIETIISDRQLDIVFMGLAQVPGDEAVVRLAANYIAVDIAGLTSSEEGFAAADIDSKVLHELITLVHEGKIGSRGAKNLLRQLPGYSGDVLSLATEAGLLQMSDDSSLIPVVQKIVADNNTQVEEFRAGKEAVLKFFVGLGMKETKGAANPQTLEKLLITEINK